MELKIKKSFFTKIWMIVVASYLLNIFYFKSISSYQKIATWFFVIVYIFLNFKIIYNNYKNIQNKIKWILLLVIMWIFFILLTPIIHGTGDFSYCDTLINILGFFINQVAIVIMLIKHPCFGNIKESYMKIVLYSSVFYVLSTLVCMLVPAFKDFIINSIYISKENLLLMRIEKYSTRIGFAGFSGYNSSLKCAIANCFAVILMIDKLFKKKKIGFILIFSYILTFLGGFFYSRTSIISLFIVLVISVLYSLKSKNVYKIFILLITIICFGLILQNVISTADSNDSLRWIFEPVINFMNEGKFTTSSSNHLLNDMLFSITPETFIFGDGRYVGPYGYYMKTDVGFMRLLLYFGFFGVLLTYYTDVLILKRIKDTFSKKINRLVFIILLLTFAIFEFKGESIGIVFPIYFNLLCCCLLAKEDTYDLNNNEHI